ncbi:hypothetical protein GOV14_02475 [Candidatus Pacearchaeota archaeon]|nr:hypothetical protein [Candidatus Pacearchaeota archaeon]
MKKKGFLSAVEIFVNTWKKKKGVEVIFLAGSYAVKNEGKFSDIDMHVLVKNKNFKSVKGLTKINGYVVEYFVSAFDSALSFLGSTFNDNNSSSVRGTLFMKVLYDKNDKAKILRHRAEQLIKKKFPKLLEKEKESLKYDLWNLHYSLKNLYLEKSPMFDHAYSLLLFRIIRHYGKFCQVEAFSFAKYYNYLTNNDFRARYLLDAHPDKLFVKKLIACIRAKEGKKKLKFIDDLVSYVLKKMGGFDENNWRLVG